MAKKSCNNCVSRFICVNNSVPCMGHNDEEVFWSLLKLPFMGEADRIDHYRVLVKGLQAEARRTDDGD